MDIPDALRDDLLRYLLATSEERARILSELTLRNSGMEESGWRDLELATSCWRFEMELPS